MSRGTVLGPWVLGLLALLAPAAIAQPPTDAASALREGNRLFRDGRIAEAIDAYTTGYAPAMSNPTLCYNLGTALHHTGRLPEAILWYRRAAEAQDPWLTENLLLARRSLGSRILPATGPSAWLGRHGPNLQIAATVLAWAALFAVAAIPRCPIWAFVGVAGLALALFGITAAGERWGPRPAVMLEDCSTPAGDLPAGTEVWVRSAPDGAWRISGVEGASCPAPAAALVFPDL